MPFKKILTNENGFTLVLSMLFLVALTIIGIAATNTTTIEATIAGNERIYKESFYLAEGAAKEASTQNLTAAWVFEPDKGNPPPEVNGAIDIDAVCSQPSNLDAAATSYGVVDRDIPRGIEGSGHSLKAEGTQPGGRMNFFDLYGQSTQGNSSVRVKMGLKRRL